MSKVTNIRLDLQLCTEVIIKYGEVNAQQENLTKFKNTLLYKIDLNWYTATKVVDLLRGAKMRNG